MLTKKRRSRKYIIALVISLCLALLVLVGALIYRHYVLNVESVVSSFETCKKASGSILLETSPEQCKTTEGKIYIGPSSQTRSEPIEVHINTYCVTGERLCFDYPDNWKVNKVSKTDTEPGNTGDDVIVTDKSATLPLELQSGMGGLGGACPDEAQKPVYVLQPTSIILMNGFESAYSLDQLKVAKVVVSDDSGKQYIPTLYVTGQKEYTKEGTINACGIFLSEFMYGRYAVQSSESSDSPGAFRFGYTGFNPTILYSSVDAAKNTYASLVYEQATAILASLRYQ